MSCFAIADLQMSLPESGLLQQMGVEHVPGGGGAAYAFLQLDGFLVFAFLCCFHVFPSFLLDLLAIQHRRFLRYNSQHGLIIFP